MTTVFYRAFLQKNTFGSYSNGWGDVDWSFFTEDPTEFIKTMNDRAKHSAYSMSGNPGIPQYRIKHLHVIHEADYESQKIYTVPIQQVTFY